MYKKVQIGPKHRENRSMTCKCYAVVTATVYAACGRFLWPAEEELAGSFHTTLRTTLATLGEVRVCMWAGREVVCTGARAKMATPATYLNASKHYDSDSRTRTTTYCLYWRLPALPT